MSKAESMLTQSVFKPTALQALRRCRRSGVDPRRELCQDRLESVKRARDAVGDAHIHPASSVSCDSTLKGNFGRRLRAQAGSGSPTHLSSARPRTAFCQVAFMPRACRVAQTANSGQPRDFTPSSFHLELPGQSGVPGVARVAPGCQDTKEMLGRSEDALAKGLPVWSPVDAVLRHTAVRFVGKRQEGLKGRDVFPSRACDASGEAGQETPARKRIGRIPGHLPDNLVSGHRDWLSPGARSYASHS